MVVVTNSRIPAGREQREKRGKEWDFWVGKMDLEEREEEEGGILRMI